MVINNRLLESSGTLAIRNGTSVYPDYVYFTGSDNTYIGSETIPINDFFRKKVIWSKNGIDSKFTVDITTDEMIGSTIYGFGLNSEEAIGSGEILVAAPSSIGLKNEFFSIETEGEIIYRRPII